MKYVLYEGENGDMLFTREDKIKENPSVLNQFVNKNPTFEVEALSDGDAVSRLNEFIKARGVRK